jgi:hypothetical protein
MNKRSVHRVRMIGVRVTDLEFEIIERAAQRKMMTAATYLRMLAAIDQEFPK